jgi:AcrR family transcriptional regulator
MDDVAQRAQFSKATIYRYYKSKVDIFYEIISKSFLDINERIRKIRKRSISAEEKLREYVAFIMSFYTKKQNIIRIFFLEKAAFKRIFDMHVKAMGGISAADDTFVSGLKKKMNDILQMVQAIIQEGIDAGEFKSVNPVDASLILGSLIRGIAFRSPLLEHKHSIGENTELVMNFFLYGIKKA